MSHYSTSINYFQMKYCNIYRVIPHSILRLTLHRDQAYLHVTSVCVCKYTRSTWAKAPIMMIDNARIN